MNTTFTNRIAEVAKEIANREGRNFSFCVNSEGIIEGCRNHKGSEEYEFDVEKERFIVNTTKMGNIEGIIEEAIDIVKNENQIVENIEKIELASVSEEANDWYKELTGESNETVLDIHVEGFENAVISEDNNYYYVDLRTGLGKAEYPKDSFTLEEAIRDQREYKLE